MGPQRMDRQIRDLLDYSRVGRKGKALTPFPIKQALDTALYNLSVAIEEQNAKIIMDQDFPMICGDDNELSRLFQNLIGNALKYKAEDREIIIHIHVVQKEEKWLFSIEDNGIGIAEQDQSRIFMLFQRLHSNTHYEGAGIGLAICKKIVERHGGTIWVESDLGQYSRFLFTLPKWDEENPLPIHQ